MEKFQKSSWIWYTEDKKADSYGDFTDSFEYNGGEAVFSISVDGDYELYINGKFVSSNQYGDFEHYKIYDDIDITGFLKTGKNDIYILVWHIGVDSSRYKSAEPGLIYQLDIDSRTVLYSNAETLSRENPNYKSGYCKIITGQLGISFLYDNSRGCDTPYTKSVVTDKKSSLFKRPVKKLEFAEEIQPALIKQEENYYLYDLGRESLGVVSFELFSESNQKITVAWGEHILDGCVRISKEKHRDFTFEYITKAGDNSFCNHMLRLGCRYLEIHTEAPVKINKLAFVPQIFPVKEKEIYIGEKLDRKIYDTCVYTLKLCMMEHYVDTPWREQSFYSFDSRNQMLCGYKVFENGNREYARANLLLISKDQRDDGLLSITYPSGGRLAIPSFSLYYFIAVKEYVENTGDITLADEVFDKLVSLTETFLKNMYGDLIFTFEDKNAWNFYDWSPYMDEGFGKTDSRPDLMINCLFIKALDSLKYICKKTGREFVYDEALRNIRSKVKSVFFREKDGLFFMDKHNSEYTELANAMAVLAGITDENESKHIAEALASGKLLECSLSMKCFKYDAMLSVDSGYRKEVLAEIRETYGKMLDKGATTVWEVAGGAAAFDKAGSLCHGWSAVPVLYLI